MKMKKWFILAALIGLLLSVSFVIIGCTDSDVKGCLSSGINSSCSSGCNSMNFSNCF